MFISHLWCSFTFVCGYSKVYHKWLFYFSNLILQTANKEELLEYIDTNSTAIANFKDKVRADQQTKNKKRQPVKRWNDARIERQVDKFTNEFISNIHDKLSKALKANNHTPKEKWIKFIEENELLDDLEESVSMIDFEEE